MDLQTYEDGEQYYDGAPRQYIAPPPQDVDENSFDPSDFFMHSALASEAVAQNVMEDGEDDINKDLQMSESEESNEDEQQGDDQSNDGFDIDEFLQWSNIMIKNEYLQWNDILVNQKTDGFYILELLHWSEMMVRYTKTDGFYIQPVKWHIDGSVITRQVLASSYARIKVCDGGKCQALRQRVIQKRFGRSFKFGELRTCISTLMNCAPNSALFDQEV